MKKKNNWFLISSIAVIALVFAALVFVTKHQEKEMAQKFPSAEQFSEAIVEGVVDDFDYENQPSIGNEDAPIKVVEFGDYKCSHCANWDRDVYPNLFKEYIETGVVEFYFINKQFLASDSVLAGVAGEAVYQQDEESFWEYHHGVFKTNEMTLGSVWGTGERLLKIAKDNITNPDFDFVKLEEDISNFTGLGEVKRDSLIADNLGVTGTPTIFVNGQKVNADFNSLKQAIEANLEVAEPSLEAIEPTNE